ncbi:MAG: hypothetical protein HY851_09315 [candidate division Zixibacteria bacterium]|nr:hypothetical protein [candidate division Zixibacteria bacterium]
MEYVNRSIYRYNPSNGYRVTSPDGATWEHAYPNGGNYRIAVDSQHPELMPGIWIDTTGIYPKSDFGGVYKFNLWGADGAGEDTVAFAGAMNDFAQLAVRPQDSGIFFYIVIRLKRADTGKHICIDSSTRFPNNNPWRWASYDIPPEYGNVDVFPFWLGPYCFVIADCCRGLSGNIDCDPNDMCDISDVTEFIDRHYMNPRPGCCSREEDVDGSSDGQADISDLTALIDYLFINFTPPAPCR